MKHLLLLVAFMASIAPLPALASGFYLPPAVELLLFLIGTPGGWAVLATTAVAMIAGILALIRRKRGAT